MVTPHPLRRVRAALIVAMVCVLGGSLAVHAPPRDRALTPIAGTPVRSVVAPAVAQARQDALAFASTAGLRADEARDAAAQSAVHAADLDAALAELHRAVALSRQWQPALAQLTPSRPAHRTPLPARAPVLTTPGVTEPTATADPARAEATATEATATEVTTTEATATEATTTDAATPDRAATDATVPTLPTSDTATTPPATTPPATADPATADPASPAPTTDPAAARVRAAATAVEQRTADLRAATAVAEEAARVAAEAEARRQAEELAAAQAEAERKAAQAASLDAYPNGEVPAEALCALDVAPGQRLRCDAAEGLEALNAAYRAEFGTDLTVTDSYRSYAAQVACLAAKGTLCATPGTSNHGRGTAVDLGGPLSRFGSTEHDWLLAHAPEFGWDLPSWARANGSKPEPWHWEFTP